MVAHILTAYFSDIYYSCRINHSLIRINKKLKRTIGTIKGHTLGVVFFMEASASLCRQI